MSIDIRLFDYTISLPRDALYKIFPECMFVIAMELDKEAKEIELTHKCITPAILECIRDILLTETIPKKLPNGLAIAGKYLGMELLEVIGDPQYDGSEDGSPAIANLINLTEKEKHDMLRHFIRCGHYSGFRHLYSFDLELTIKYQLLTIAIIFNQLDIVRYILRESDLNVRDIPYYNEMNLTAMLLDEHLVKTYVPFLFRIDLLPILYYARYANPDIFSLIFSRVKNFDGLFYILYDSKCKPEIWNILLSHSKLSLDALLSSTLVIRGNLNTVQLLFNHPNFNKFSFSLTFNIASLHIYYTSQDTDNLDYFYTNYPMSVEKSSYIVKMIPQKQEQHDLYISASKGILTQYDRYSIDLLYISVQFGHIHQIKELLKFVKERIDSILLQNLLMIARYNDRQDIIGLLTDVT